MSPGLGTSGRAPSAGAKAKESGNSGRVSFLSHLPTFLRTYARAPRSSFRHPTFTPLYLLDDSGQQRTEDWGQGITGTGATSERYDTSGQYGGQERFASDPTSGSADPTMGRTGYGERDDDPAGAGGGGRPSATSKIMGTSARHCWRSGAC